MPTASAGVIVRINESAVGPRRAARRPEKPSDRSAGRSRGPSPRLARLRADASGERSGGVVTAGRDEHAGRLTVRSHVDRDPSGRSAADVHEDGADPLEGNGLDAAPGTMRRAVA